MNNRKLAASTNLSLRDKMVSALVNHDEKMAKRRHYNRHALGIYMAGVSEVEEKIAAGVDPRTAILAAFCGVLGDKVLRACGFPIQTKEEMRR